MTKSVAAVVTTIISACSSSYSEMGLDGVIRTHTTDFSPLFLGSCWSSGDSFTWQVRGVRLTGSEGNRDNYWPHRWRMDWPSDFRRKWRHNWYRRCGYTAGGQPVIGSVASGGSQGALLAGTIVP